MIASHKMDANIFSFQKNVFINADKSESIKGRSSFIGHLIKLSNVIIACRKNKLPNKELIIQPFEGFALLAWIFLSLASFFRGEMAGKYVLSKDFARFFSGSLFFVIFVEAN